MTQFITRQTLDALVAEAQAAPRGRKNLNFHPDNDFPAHRLLNAVEPGSYIMPHRHQDPRKDETMVCLAGALGVILFDDKGEVSSTRVLTPGGETLGVDIAHGTYHSVLALCSGTVFLEAKSGPYAALTETEIAPWAPREGSAEAAAYYKVLAAKFGGL